MPPKPYKTHPSPEAIAALYSRMAWFFARQEAERQIELEKEKARKRTQKARRRAPAARAQ